MPLTVAFELSDQDIQHFLEIAREAQAAVSSATDVSEISSAVRDLLAKTRQAESIPTFVADRLKKLQTLVDMVDDAAWKLQEDDLTRVLNALAYFANPEDLIPDRVPGIGFLDDAIMIELVARDMEFEFEAYEEFCAFRESEQKRRADQTDPKPVGHEDWLADKRAVLHSRMRKRRAGRDTSSGWKVRLW